MVKSGHMKRTGRRNKKGYDGVYPTTYSLKNLLPVLVEKLTESQEIQPQLVIEKWEDLIGPRFKGITTAKLFVDGVLYVHVKNSTLYSLLNMYEKEKLVIKLRQAFPKIKIKTIQFRIG